MLWRSILGHTIREPPACKATSILVQAGFKLVTYQLNVFANLAINPCLSIYYLSIYLHIPIYLSIYLSIYLPICSLSIDL